MARVISSSVPEDPAWSCCRAVPFRRPPSLRLKPFRNSFMSGSLVIIAHNSPRTEAAVHRFRDWQAPAPRRAPVRPATSVGKQAISPRILARVAVVAGMLLRFAGRRRTDRRAHRWPSPVHSGGLGVSPYQVAGGIAMLSRGVCAAQPWLAIPTTDNDVRFAAVTASLIQEKIGSLDLGGPVANTLRLFGPCRKTQRTSRRPSVLMLVSSPMAPEDPHCGG
jgi:hypothetical protein